MHEQHRQVGTGRRHAAAAAARPFIGGRRAVRRGRQRRPGVRDRCPGRRDAPTRALRRKRDAEARRRRARQPHLPQRRAGFGISRGGGHRCAARCEQGAHGDRLDVAAARVALRAAADRRRVPVPEGARRHHPRDDGAPARSSRQRPVPDGDRVLRLLARRSELAAAEHADRAGARLRNGRHQHARHRLLGRRVRLLRAAPVDRRLRRDRDDRRAAVGRPSRGRHGRPVVPGHLAALRRAAAAAAPRRHRAVVGDRRHPPGNARAGRDPQHRVRGRVGEGPAARRRARARRWPAVGDRPHPGRRQAVQGQPGAAQPGARPAREHHARTSTGPTRSGCRSRPSTS